MTSKGLFKIGPISNAVKDDCKPYYGSQSLRGFADPIQPPQGPKEHAKPNNDDYNTRYGRLTRRAMVYDNFGLNALVRLKP